MATDSDFYIAALLWGVAVGWCVGNIVCLGLDAAEAMARRIKYGKDGA